MACAGQTRASVQADALAHLKLRQHALAVLRRRRGSINTTQHNTTQHNTTQHNTTQHTTNLLHSSLRILLGFTVRKLALVHLQGTVPTVELDAQSVTKAMHMQAAVFLHPLKWQFLTP